MASRVRGSVSSTGGMGAAWDSGIASSLPHELVAEPLAIRLDQPGGRMREMDRQDEAAGPGGVAEEAPTRLRRLLRVPVEHRRPVRLAALQGVVHHVSDHHRMLAARSDVDAAVAGRIDRKSPRLN